MRPLSGSVVSTLSVKQVGRAYSIVAMQHPSHTRGMVYEVLLLTIGPVPSNEYLDIRSYQETYKVYPFLQIFIKINHNMGTYA